MLFKGMTSDFFTNPRVSGHAVTLFFPFYKCWKMLHAQYETGIEKTWFIFVFMKLIMKTNTDLICNIAKY